MIVTILAVRKSDPTLTFEYGRNHIAGLNITEDLVADLLNEGVLYDDEDGCFDDDGNFIVDGVRKWMLNAVDELAGCINGRGVSQVSVRDLYLYITGGMSWGDDTDEGIIFSRAEGIPGLVEAIGFVPDWYEVEHGVTPEEEAAAVESIKTVVV